MRERSPCGASGNDWRRECRSTTGSKFARESALKSEFECIYERDEAYNLGSRLALSVTWLVCAALLGWLTSKGAISGATFGALVIASTFVFGFISFRVVRCPHCRHSLFGAARTRCRICGREI